MPHGSCNFFCKKLICMQTLFRSTEFYYNLFLPPVLKDGISKAWHDHGIQSFDKRYEGHTCLSNNYNRNTFSPLNSSSTYRLDIIFRHGIKIVSLSPLEAILFDKSDPKGFISFIYGNSSRRGLVLSAMLNLNGEKTWSIYLLMMSGQWYTRKLRLCL